MTLAAGQTIAGYSIIGQIGSGGMATVYQAYHERLDRHVAIKLLHQTFVQDASFRERFEREARIVARLEHAHIVPIYDYAEHEGVPFLVMKHISGGTLKRRLIKRGISLEEIKSMMTQLAGALTYAHEMGVLHRDIKPSNVLIDEHDLAYLTDFGLARIAQLGDSTISHDMMLGTPQYISPEQAKGERELTPATDVYSFGVILYELLVGVVPFSGDTPYAIVHEHIYTPPRPPSALRPELGVAIDGVLLKALAKSPEQRYQTATALMEDFKLALAESGVTALPPDRRVVRAPGQVANEQVDSWTHEDFAAEAEQIRDLAYSMREKLTHNRAKRKRKGPASEDEIRRRTAEKKFKSRQELIQHLTTYLIVNLILWTLYWSTARAFPWPIFVTAFWGIRIATHIADYYYRFGKGAQSRETEVEAEMARQLRMQNLRDEERQGEMDREADIFDMEAFEKRKVRLNDEGELTDSFVEEAAHQEDLTGRRDSGRG